MTGSYVLIIKNFNFFNAKSMHLQLKKKLHQFFSTLFWSQHTKKFQIFRDTQTNFRQKKKLLLADLNVSSKISRHSKPQNRPLQIHTWHAEKFPIEANTNVCLNLGQPES